MDLPFLGSDPTQFPRVETALEDPSGLLAFGGDLSSQRLLSAYQQGIFPWYSEGQPILWWSPDPRLVIDQNHLKVSRSLKKSLRNKGYQVTLNHAFDSVIRSCQRPDPNRPGRESTWITEEMCTAYIQLHHLGHAHSVEVWQAQQLVGGLYGIGVGCAFFGESMFSSQTDASKVAFVYLIQHLDQRGFTLIDCQVENPHLSRLGAYLIPRSTFLEQIHGLKQQPSPADTWTQQTLRYFPLCDN